MNTPPLLWAIFSRSQLVWYQTTWVFYVKTTDPGNHPWTAWRTHHICILYIYILCANCRICRLWLSFPMRPTISTTSYEAKLPELQSWGRISMKSWWDAPWAVLPFTFLKRGSATVLFNESAAGAPFFVKIHFFHHLLFLIKNDIFAISQMNKKFYL